MKSLPSTLLKYHVKRWALPLAGSCVFFGGLLITNDLVQVSKDIFSQGAPLRWLVPIMLTTLPETFALVLPMASILGGLIGTQQLSEGSEMVASQGLGVGMRALLRAWVLLSAGLLLLALVNAHVLVPRIGGSVNRIEDAMTEDTKTRFLKPGGHPFFPPQNPQTAVWVSPAGEVHLLEVSDSDVQHLVAKDFSWQREAEAGGKASISLKLLQLKGCYYQKNNASVGLLDQASQVVRIDIPPRRELLAPTPVQYLPTGELLRQRSKDCWIEFSRRITLPLSAVAFLLLGIGLGMGHPRFRKGGALVRSLGVILAYYLVMKFTENLFSAGRGQVLYLFLPPFLFLAAGFLVLRWKMRPHRIGRFSRAIARAHVERIIGKLQDLAFRTFGLVPTLPMRRSQAPGVLGRWTRKLWWTNWGATVACLVTLDLLIEFVRLAGTLSKNRIPAHVFLEYWFWSLPSFLVIAFPISFLLGGVLTFSEATVTREWVALRAGGTSLLQWIRAGSRAWLSILVLTFACQAIIDPAFTGKANHLNKVIKQKVHKRGNSRGKTWMNLSSQEVLWFLEKDRRWGFPLKSPGESPILYRWEQNAAHADQLPWDALSFEPGPPASALFPSEALRKISRADETSTLDLFLWLKWAPDSECATLFWARLFNWLSGPCLLFAMLAFTFPSPRGGKGQVLGLSIVAGLLFLALQALFDGAARAGEIPALWGVTFPLLILMGVGLVNLKHLKT